MAHAKKRRGRGLGSTEAQHMSRWAQDRDIAERKLGESTCQSAIGAHERAVMSGENLAASGQSGRMMDAVRLIERTERAIKARCGCKTKKR